MKKILLFLLIFIISLFLSGQQINNVQKQDTIKKIDTLKVKLSDNDRKKLEYEQYQRRQQTMNKNFEKMDKTIVDIEKQSLKIDSILKKKK